MSSNKLKGRNSYDSKIANTDVTFVNRNISPYPTEVGGPNFAPIPIEKHKDIMVNVARMHAQQEYDRIMELVAVLQKQAQGIKRRLDLTDMVHAAKYEFKPVHGKTYWLVWDERKEFYRLAMTGPNHWGSSPPAEYKYIMAVKWLGDHTWIEDENESI